MFSSYLFFWWFIWINFYSPRIESTRGFEFLCSHVLKNVAIFNKHVEPKIKDCKKLCKIIFWLIQNISNDFWFCRFFCSLWSLVQHVCLIVQHFSKLIHLFPLKSYQENPNWSWSFWSPTTRCQISSIFYKQTWT